MKEKLLFFSIKHPLLYILLFAIVMRLLAVIFTPGFVETDLYGNCLTCSFNHYQIPESWYQTPWIVYIARLLLGAFSLLIITLSYRITKIIADKTTALEIALLMSFIWIIPIESVHPVSYIVAVPFLLYGTLLILKQHNLLSNNEIEKYHRTTFIIAGFFLGLGFAVEYTSLIFYIGILIALLLMKNWKGALMTLIGFIVSVCLTQTIIDLIIYHRPFVSMGIFFSTLDNYLTYKISILTCVLPIIILIGLVVVPLSIMIMIGFFRVIRKYLLLFMPTLMVMVISIFYKEITSLSESFFGSFLTIIPTFVIAGFVGWKEFYKNSAFWTRNRWLSVTLYAVFAVINTVLFFMSFSSNFFTK